MFTTCRILRLFPSASKCELEPDGTEVELVPGFRVIVLTDLCPEIFEGGRILDCWGIFEIS